MEQNPGNGSRKSEKSWQVWRKNGLNNQSICKFQKGIETGVWRKCFLLACHTCPKCFIETCCTPVKVKFDIKVIKLVYKVWSIGKLLHLIKLQNVIIHINNYLISSANEYCVHHWQADDNTEGVTVFLCMLKDPI